ncbi:hypothetical protein [Streptomyces rubradiris]|uniref:CdiI C-terminal domain-containing protein n=1 Tax=Streptomyces rubradiris TaxID=285531 RepID=A0ABQ3RHB0_STRRR|nr:hypothetical protein [Streptomyces rubradiris]GHH31359.1 hypothetical protein GCM10018792_79020 [Streptomyces rubradiris]GHI55234.1 hypothetical protein Srubr_50800 [Streptomyces rubradiris]
MTQTSTTSRSEAFSIRVLSVPSRSGVAAGESAIGHITVGDFEESFPMDLTYWGVEQYQTSWASCLRILEGGHDTTSCLISSITDPSHSNFITCWPLYRSGETVFIQNSIIFLEDLPEHFNPAEPWHSVEPRSTVDEEGHEVSEWQTTISEIRRFLHMSH